MSVHCVTFLRCQLKVLEVCGGSAGARGDGATSIEGLDAMLRLPALRGLVRLRHDWELSQQVEEQLQGLCVAMGAELRDLRRRFTGESAPRQPTSRSPTTESLIDPSYLGAD